MPRYIDAEALKKDLTRFYDSEVTARELIDEQPTADVQPVKPAHWYINPDGYYPQCSNCGYEPPRELIRHIGGVLIYPRYCSECGADTKRKVK